MRWLNLFAASESILDAWRLVSMLDCARVAVRERKWLLRSHHRRRDCRAWATDHRAIVLRQTASGSLPEFIFVP
jgi:hypothetical protein